MVCAEQGKRIPKKLLILDPDRQQRPSKNKASDIIARTARNSSKSDLVVSCLEREASGAQVVSPTMTWPEMFMQRLWQVAMQLCSCAQPGTRTCTRNSS